jgi:metal transporter CNNM
MIDSNLIAPLTWLGVALCASQSAMFSGLNLALFGISRLNLEVEVASGNERAKRMLALRRDSNFLLATILWGNVGVNCLLTLLTDSVLSGAAGFVVSTVVITFGGEIMPQAYFSRNALRMAALLAPVLRFYQILLYPVAKPCGLVLDAWLGKEGIEYYRERDLREVLNRHVQAEETDLEHTEGRGALNFMDLDDLPVCREGEEVDPESIISLPTTIDLPQLPAIRRDPEDPFVKQVAASGHKWVILTDPQGAPRLVLDADAFLRELTDSRVKDFSAYDYCARPIVVHDPNTPLGKVIVKLTVEPEHHEDDVIDQDTILVWCGTVRRIITGADLLGRLFRGIVRRKRVRGADVMVPPDITHAVNPPL